MNSIYIRTSMALLLAAAMTFQNPAPVSAAGLKSEKQIAESVIRDQETGENKGTKDPLPSEPSNPSDPEPSDKKPTEKQLEQTSIINASVLINDEISDHLTEKETADIQLILKNNAVKTSQVTSSEPGLKPEGISIDRLGDGFRGGDNPEIELNSEQDQPLRLTVTFKNVKWKGKDDEFRLQLDMGGYHKELGIRIYEVKLSDQDNQPGNGDSDDLPSIDSGGSADYGGFGGISDGGGSFSNSDPVKINSATPNLIVTKYSYGKDTVKAGTPFELTLDFKNTSRNLKVENIVMSIEPEGGLTIADGSNTFYFETLAPQASQQLKIRMKAANPENGANPAVNIGFRYEYVDNDQRSEKTSAEKIVIPVVQKDRMEVTEPALTEPAFVGQEFVLSFPYVNKGKGTLYNVAIKAEGEGFSTLVPVQNLGNFESGKSGSMDLVIIPTQTGQLNFKVILTYEDADEKEVKKEYPIELMVSEAPVMDPSVYENMTPEEPETSSASWIWLAAAVLVAAGAGIFFYRKKKKKKAAGSDQQDLDSLFDEEPSEKDDLKDGK